MSTQTSESSCDAIRPLLDDFIDRALSAEREASIGAHLATCAGCTHDLELLREMRARLKSAVRNMATPPFLESRIRARVFARRRAGGWSWKLVISAATALVCASIFIAYQQGHFRYSRASQDSYISTIASPMPALMRVGLGDHIHCAVFRKYPKNPPSIAQFIEKMGPKYSGLIPIVRDRIPSDYKLLLAHQCGYQGRKFVHLTLRNDSHLMSLVIARKADGESFHPEQLVPALNASGLPLYNSSTQRFQIAAFETREYAVYLVSDLPQQGNTAAMVAMVPQLQAYLEKLEG